MCFMKFYVGLFFCINGILAITVRDESGEHTVYNNKKHENILKDIRAVPFNQIQARQKNTQPRRRPNEEFATLEKPDVKLTNAQNGQQIYIRPREDIIKTTLGHQFSTRGNLQQGNIENENQKLYMDKMANQLYLAQKHVSRLSDYQKFIINQDPLVKNYVFGSSAESRKPKQFSYQKQAGRSVSAQGSNAIYASEPVTRSTTMKRIVVVNAHVPTTSEKIPQQTQQNDHWAQSTDVKYDTLQPQLLPHFVGTHEAPRKVVLLHYSTPQTNAYYDSGTTHAPQIEAEPIHTTLSVGLGAYKSLKPQHESRFADDHRHSDPQYKFMYKVKDQEKNNHFGHMESRTDKATYGYYFVQLPDGRMETVKYWADKTGYHAKVDYEGKAVHPPSAEHKVHSHPNPPYH